MFIAMLACLLPSPTHATVPEFPILMGAQMMLVSFSTISENQQLLGELPTREMRRRLAAYLTRRLKEENLPVVVEEMGRSHILPAGVLQHNVVSVFVRADLANTAVDEHQTTIGAVGILLNRESSSSAEYYLSHKPMTFFVVEGDQADLEDKVLGAAQDQIEISVIGPLVLLLR